MFVCQDDDDGHLLALQIIRDLVDKGGDVFLDQLARLGVINKVSTLAGPASDDENEDEAKPEKVSACVCGPELKQNLFLHPFSRDLRDLLLNLQGNILIHKHNLMTSRNIKSVSVKMSKFCFLETSR